MDRVTFFFGGWEPILRIIVVGALAFTALVFLLRITGKRTLARMNAFDFVITVAIGASFGRILTARSVALAEAITAFALLILLQYVVTWLQVRAPGLTRLVTAPPTLLFFRGKMLHDAMRRERVSEEDLRTALRESGLGAFDEAEAVILESDGRFAVIKEGKAGDGTVLSDVT